MADFSSGIGTPYWFEWEIGLIKCLDMLSDTTIESVVLQSSEFQSLDDVVVNYVNGSSCNIQVKHSESSNSFTYGTLSSGEKPLLKKWAQEWNDCKERFQIAEIRIVTNRKWGSNKVDGRCPFSVFVREILPELQKNYNYSSDRQEEQNAVLWFRSQLEFLGDEAAEFVKVLSFTAAGDLKDIEEEIENKVVIILGTSNGTAVDLAKKALFAKLRIWATSRRERQEITREDVYKVLCVDSELIPSYNLYPQKPIFSSRKRFAEHFIRLIKSTEKKIVFLEGMPGSGKTNFVSYIAQLDNSPVDFRFYTYLPVNKEYPSYSDDEGFYSGKLLWKSMLSQLKKRFEDMGKLSDIEFPLMFSYLSVSEMRETVLKYLPKYAALAGHVCNIFIDGLDHAARSKDVRNSFLCQLPTPEEIGNDVRFILVSQPIGEGFPLWLNNNPQIEYVTLPSLEQDDVIMLLRCELSETWDLDYSSLAQSIIDVVGKNTLNVLFAIQELKLNGPFCSFDSIIEYLKQRRLNGQISRYYDWIVGAVDNDVLLQKIQFIFGFASQKITIKELALLCEQPAYDTANALYKLFPLIIQEEGEYYTLHNDVRLFFKKAVLCSGNIAILATTMRNQVLCEEELAHFAYDVVFGSLYELEDIKLILSVFTQEYIVKSLKYCIPLDKLLSQFDAVLSLVAKRRDLEAINQLSLVATVLNQFLGCVHYYSKEKEYYENSLDHHMTKSEQYVLDRNKDFVSIVNDTYFLLSNNRKERARSLFDEYLLSYKLGDYLSQTVNENEQFHEGLGFYEQCGYICRHFSPAILKGQNIDNDHYSEFVSGWLHAAIEYTQPKEIEITFSFERYFTKSLYDYITGICEQNDVPTRTIESINMILLEKGGVHVHVGILVELCAKEILIGCCPDVLINEIRLRFSEIITDSTKELFNYASDKFLVFFKAYFCIFRRVSDISSLIEQYYAVLKENRITKEARGYRPAIDQFEQASIVFNGFYSSDCDIDDYVNAIYDLAYIGDRFGVGSCQDCQSYSVRKFLLKIAYEAFQKEHSIPKISELCSKMMLLFIGKKPRYVRELAQLYYEANEKDKYLRIAEFWAGSSGYMWKKEYSEIEYYYESINKILEEFGLSKEKKEIELRKRYRIISYSGHKDYSLNDLLKWYNFIPQNPQKLMKWGVRLLSVSDNALLIGDNRMSESINHELFRTAVSLGPQYVDALFEIKNTPNDFFSWRELLLESYWEELDRARFSNADLFSLYQLVNAWINTTIEENKTRGGSKVAYLQKYNSKILSLVTDESMQAIIEGRGNCSCRDTEQYEYSENAERFESLLDMIKEEGYTESSRSQIWAVLNTETSGKHSFLLSVGGELKEEEIDDYVHGVVIEYILMNHKYSLRSNGLDQLIERYYEWFTIEDWQRLLLSTASKSSSRDENDFYGLCDDLEILDRYYNLKNHKDQIESYFDKKIGLHWDIITACGLLDYEYYSLLLDPHVNTLQDFVRKQIGDF